MALTRITQGVIKPNENYDTHNINSTGIVTATALNISGDASIGGVLTYEDVTNVDSVGLLTARSGIRFGGHILPTVNETYDIGSADKKVRHLFLSDNSLKFVDSSDTEHPLSLDSGRLKFAGGMLLGSDIQLDPISGIITATSFAKGDGGEVGEFTTDNNFNLIAGVGAGSSIGAEEEHNIFLGFNAGAKIDHNTSYSQTGKYNVIIGSNAAFNDVLPRFNTIIGYESKKNGNGGYEVTAVGKEALRDCTGNFNTALGAQAGRGNTSAEHSVFVGFQAASGGNGDDTIAIGSQTLGSLTSGDDNIAIGRQSGWNISSGHGNICLGRETGGSSGNYNICIGTRASHTGNPSNECLIGGNPDQNWKIDKFRIPGIGVTFATSGNHITGVTTFSGGRLTLKSDVVQHNGYHWYGFHGSNLYIDINASHWGLRASGAMNAFISANSSGGTTGRVHLSGGSSGGRVYVNGPGGVELHHSGSSDKKFETTSSGITVSGSVTDSKGDLRKIPLDTYNSSHTLVVQNAGETVYISSGGVTIPSGTFSQGDAVTIINNSGSDQTITCSAVTTYLAGDTSSKSSLTLKGRGMATFYFASSSEVYGSGAGLS